jgi:hypothetical protein
LGYEEIVDINVKKISPLIDCDLSSDHLSKIICKSDSLTAHDFYFYSLYKLKFNEKENTLDKYIKERNKLFSETIKYLDGDGDEIFFDTSIDDISVYQAKTLYNVVSKNFIVDMKLNEVTKVKSRILIDLGLDQSPKNEVKRFFWSSQRDAALGALDLFGHICVNLGYKIHHQTQERLVYELYGSSCRGMGSTTSLNLACLFNDEFLDQDINIPIKHWKFDSGEDLDNFIASKVNELAGPHNKCVNNKDAH